VRSGAIGRNFTGGLFGFPQRPEIRKWRSLKKGGDLRKHALRRSPAGDMIGALGMATTTGEAMRTSRAPGQAMEMADVIGLSRRRASKPRKGRPSCVDCFFHCQMLCALDLDEPCSTFRPNTEDGLVPPRQPSLLLREAPDEAPAQAA
jgi:hypothetical protein